MDDHMHLALFYLPIGRLEGAWRRPSGKANLLWGLDLPVRVAQQAEDAKLDAIFIADFTTVFDIDKRPQEAGGYEPITLLAALAAKTSKVGLIGTISTSFFTPYDTARFLASIDHLSNGRAGWNIVTSATGGQNYGIELLPKHDRYRRAAEHVSLTKAFWDAWADDAVISDRDAGKWADSSRVGPVTFGGEFFSVSEAGPLCAHRSPQGWPVLVQAGQSDDGRSFAASHAEVIFTSQNDVDLARAFRTDIRKRANAVGRDPSSISVLPGFVPIVGRTERDAHDLAAEVHALVDLTGGRRRLAADMMGADLSDLELDEPVPLERLVAPETIDHADTTLLITASRYRNYHTIVESAAMTLRQLIIEREIGGGHGLAVGSAAQVADQMERWFRHGACDGFMFNLPIMPEPFDAICTELVPELQRRDLFRSDYRGSTLRDHFGLVRPASHRRV